MLQAPGVLDDVDSQYHASVFHMVLNEGTNMGYFLSSDDVHKVDQIFHEVLENACNLGRTAKLWIKYLEHVLILLGFIRAERTGNWQLHIKRIHEIPPIFQSQGHIE